MNKAIKNLIFFGLLIIVQFVVLTVYAKRQQNNALKEDVTITLSPENLHDLLLKQQNQGEYQVKTSGNDPYLFIGKLAQQIRLIIIYSPSNISALPGSITCKCFLPRLSAKIKALSLRWELPKDPEYQCP